MSEETATITALGNKKVKNKVAAFVEFVEANKNRHFYVCCHDNPDPDALSSAIGVVRILDFLGVLNTDVVYCGEISHPQNRAMANILNLRISKWKTIEPVEGAAYIFVDCMGQQQNNMSVTHDPHIVIDHHKGTIPKGVLSIHDEVGSCATLVTDLMLSVPSVDVGEGSKLDCFDPSTEGMKEIATALAVGIKTDTVDFRSETTTDIDFQAYKFLTKYMNDDKFNKIINYELPAYMFDFEQVAWENRVFEPPNFITGLRFVEPSKSDCIPYLADKFMRLTGIQTVVVYGIVGNTLRASVRTTSAAIDCSDLCSSIFGAGNGGAKHGIGGASVVFSVFETADLTTEEEKENFWNLVKGQIERKFKKVTQK